MRVSTKWKLTLPLASRILHRECTHIAHCHILFVPKYDGARAKRIHSRRIDLRNPRRSSGRIQGLPRFLRTLTLEAIPLCSLASLSDASSLYGDNESTESRFTVEKVIRHRPSRAKSRANCASAIVLLFSSSFIFRDTSSLVDKRAVCAPRKLLFSANAFPLVM